MKLPDRPTPPHPTAPPALTVFQLTQQIKHSLEAAFPAVWVCGEISNLSRPQSGHVYLTLKDARAQLRATMWQSVAARLKFELHDGLEVVCLGDIDVYPPRGSYQLIVRRIEPLGIGGLQLAFQQLHERLSAAGLFAPERKRPLPKFPRRIAFVTSPSGAAVRDFLEVARRRWRGARVLIVPARVQGPGAAAEIVAGIERVNSVTPPIDVLVVGRGGGSQEDLWCFNEEPVVRAVAASRIPVVSAVGHEIDITLCDLAADIRALTPTEAAERIVPSTEQVRGELANYRMRLEQAARMRLVRARGRIEALERQRVLRRPLEFIHILAQRLDELELRAARALRNRQSRAGERLAASAARLESLSPVAVLSRGYSITERAATGAVVRSATEIAVGDVLVTRFASGAARSRVEEIAPAHGMTME